MIKLILIIGWKIVWKDKKFSTSTVFLPFFFLVKIKKKNKRFEKKEAKKKKKQTMNVMRIGKKWIKLIRQIDSGKTARRNDFKKKIRKRKGNIVLETLKKKKHSFYIGR